MKTFFLEIVICLTAAMSLMIFHEGVKLVVYACCHRSVRCFKTSPWKIWRYIDPIGLIIALTSYVPVSKPYFFRVRERKINIYLGVAGFLSLLLILVSSIIVLRMGYGGLDGLDHLVIHHWWESIVPIYVQYMAMLSFGMLVANLFPVSIFDMGLIIAGMSPKMYLGIIKSDGIVKIIFVIVLLLDVIHYGAVRLIALFL